MEQSRRLLLHSLWRNAQALIHLASNLLSTVFEDKRQRWAAVEITFEMAAIPPEHKLCWIKKDFHENTKNYT